MAEGLNKVILIGNVGDEPELRHTQNGGSVLNLSVATTTVYYDASKERKESTEWHKVTIWGKPAERIAAEAHKGSRVAVEGALKTNTWTDKEGNKKKDVVINASSVHVLNATPQHRETRATEADVPNDADSDDIPF